VHDLILSAAQHVVMVLRRCRSLSPKAICNKRHLIAVEGIESFRVLLIAAEVACGGSPGAFRAIALAIRLTADMGAATNCLGVHFMVGADLDVPTSEALCSVVLPAAWHECGTPPLVSI
jgi:hypothetical protein